MVKKKLNIQAIDKLVITAHESGSPRDQFENFIGRGYAPFPWQWKFHSAARECDKSDGPVKLGAGGARGPGKSHCVFSQVTLDDCQRQKGLKCLFLRQTGTAARESFNDLILRVLIGKIDYNYNRAENILSFPNGSRVVLGGFHDERDIDKYIGIEYDLIAIEELNQLTKEKVDKLLGSMRTSKEHWRPRMYASFNPGGLGHSYVKELFIEPFRKKQQTGTMFIPATYKDNPRLNKEYIEYLEGLVGDLGRAWREGDWDLLAGQFFKKWRYDKHTYSYFPIPETFRRFGCLDFGSTAPFAFYWVAMDWDGLLWVYREYYKAGETAENNAKNVVIMTPNDERLEFIVADRAIFSKQGYGETIADILKRNGIGQPGTKLPMLEPSMGGKGSRVSGAQLFLQKLDWNVDKLPGIRFLDTCTDVIRTIPSLTHDEHNPEDVDKKGEDHSFDSLKYLLQKLEDVKTKKPLIGVEAKLAELKQKQEMSPAAMVNTRFTKDI